MINNIKKNFKRIRITCINIVGIITWKLKTKENGYFVWKTTYR